MRTKMLIDSNQMGGFIPVVSKVLSKQCQFAQTYIKELCGNQTDHKLVDMHIILMLQHNEYLCICSMCK